MKIFLNGLDDLTQKLLIVPVMVDFEIKQQKKLQTQLNIWQLPSPPFIKEED